MEKQKWIDRFLTHLDARSDVGEARKKKYKGQLKYIAKWCPCDFEDATKADMEKLVANVKNARRHMRVPDKRINAGYRIVEGKPISDSTKASYLTTIKLFWRWLRNEEAGKDIYDFGTPDYPPEVKWIRNKGLRLGSAVQSKDEFLTEDEFSRLIQLAPPKYKALWALLQEKGMRINEVLTCKISDFNQINDTTATLTVAQNIKGKTKFSARTVGIVKSLPFILRWLNEHPKKENTGAWLFPNGGNYQKNAMLTSTAALRMMKKVAKAAGIKKRVWHHLFRHEAITTARGELNMGDGVVKQEFGLAPASRVLANYSHLTADDANRAYFEARGVWKPGKKRVDKTQPKACPWCGHNNPFTNTYCDECTRPLEPQKINEYVQRDTLARAVSVWLFKKHPELFDEVREYLEEGVIMRKK